MFRLFEVFVIFLFLLIAMNIVRYCFFKTTKGGWLLGLSNMWLEDERVAREAEEAKANDTTTKTRTRKGKA